MSFLALEDIPTKKLHDLISISIQNKKGSYKFESVLRNRSIGILFQYPSTRTRIAFQAAIAHLGGSGVPLLPNELQISRGEGLGLTLEVAAKYLDGLIVRAPSHKALKEISDRVSIPVINALSEESHPTQILADMMTILEFLDDFQGVTLCYIGDGSNNICRTLMKASVYFRFRLRIYSPLEYSPDQERIAYAKSQGADIFYSNAFDQTLGEANVLYTDVWTSMGHEEENNKRRNFLAPYQINTNLLNKMSRQPIVMHCMPIHIGEELTQEVFEVHKKTILTQAENKFHTAKALLHYLYS